LPAISAPHWPHERGAPVTWAIENYDLLAIAFGEHIVLVATALAISLVIAFPLGIWTARRPALYVAAMTVTGVLYTIPALALFALLLPFMGLGKAPAITALVLYSLLILVRNIAIGIREVPAELIEAADGMGYGKGRRLIRIELPMALPVIVAGIRITAVTQIAVATVAAYINAGGLGDIIFQGIAQDFGEKIAAGAVLTSLLAIAADESLKGVERRLRAATSERI
jgi:osmoprotectant transport system permease protein